MWSRSTIIFFSRLATVILFNKESEQQSCTCIKMQGFFFIMRWIALKNEAVKTLSELREKRTLFKSTFSVHFYCHILWHWRSYTQITIGFMCGSENYFGPKWSQPASYFGKLDRVKIVYKKSSNVIKHKRLWTFFIHILRTNWRSSRKISR